MNHLPKLITELALILMTAGVVTLIFKRLKQPLVLGYIVAGFLAGPHMAYAIIKDTSRVGTWAEIGVIFIMFSLGLEFSFKKVVKSGGGTIIATGTIIFSMIAIGALVGHLFGWSRMDSIFLGGILAISSTTIIYKALGDMGLRQQRFSNLVLSVLVLEDILAILLMVMLSTVAVSRDFEGMELANSLFRLGFCLLAWFIIGVFFIPLFLRKNRKWINKETLLIVSLGLCFAMVVLAVKMGYSAAFGAFMMGSILAETVEAESINKLVSPIKDLFGAIFFVSVGMLVEPNVLSDYWIPILVITATIIVGQCIFGTGGFLLSGQPLRVSMQCGFSMTQIGEFSFIIASLGVGLGVTSSFLYPIVVAVSVITTFTTPYMIRLSAPAYTTVERFLPNKLRGLLNELSPGGPTKKDETAWRRLLLALTKQVVSYSVLSISVIALSLNFLLPFIRTTFTHWYGNVICGLITLLAISPFLRAIVMRKNHSDDFRTLWNETRMNRLPLFFTVIVRFIISTAFVFYIINYLSPYPSLLHWFAAMMLMYVIIMSRSIKNGSIRLEHTFLQNLRSRDMQAEVMGQAKPQYARHLQSRDVHLTDLELPMNTRWAGRTLLDLELGQKHGIMVASILRGGRRINIPGAKTHLFPGDRLQVIGDDTHLKKFAERIDAEIIEEETNIEEREIFLECLEIKKHSSFINKTVSESDIRSRHHCMLIGFEDGDEQLTSPTAERVFHEGDLVWLVGERKSIKHILNA